jgi:hypothetical protein
MTVQAFLRILQNLDPCELALRVGTPFAPQRTAFEKNDGTDAGSVIDTVFLDIEDHAGFISVCLHF